MSHHFDTKLSKEDPSLNICDMYVFDGEHDRTTMVMTVNADTLLSSADVFHPEGIYAFRIDLDGDLREDLVYKFRFTAPEHAPVDEHRHIQKFQIIEASGSQPALSGKKIAEGETGKIVVTEDLSFFAGLVPELWAVDAVAFQASTKSVAEEGQLDTSAWGKGTNTFQNRNVMAIVIEVPNRIFSTKKLGLWSTISLFGHAPEVQIYRYGLPLFTHLLLWDTHSDALLDAYHAGSPSADNEMFTPTVARTIERFTVGGPREHDRTYQTKLVSRFCPSILHYGLGSSASFNTSGFNGRSLKDDVADVIWTLVAGRLIFDGVNPDPSRQQPHFPYYGKPYTSDEQRTVIPLKTLIGYHPK